MFHMSYLNLCLIEQVKLILNSLTWREKKRKNFTFVKFQNEFFEPQANIIPRKISENTKISDLVSLMAYKTLDVSLNSMLTLS